MQDFLKKVTAFLLVLFISAPLYSPILGNVLVGMTVLHLL